MKNTVSLMIVFFSITIVTDTLAMLSKRISKISKLENYQSIQQKQYSTDDKLVIKNKEFLFDAVLREDKDLEHVLSQRGVRLSKEDINLIIKANEPTNLCDEASSLRTEALHELMQEKRKTFPPYLKLFESWSTVDWQNRVLWQAVQDNDIEIATLALKKGVISTHKAILDVKSVEMFQLLQKNGCNIHVERDRGWICPGGNLLHMIMQQNIKDDNLIEYILTQDLDVKALNGDGGNLWASLVHACPVNDDKQLKYAIVLHMWGIDPYHKNYKGYSAIDIAKIELSYSAERYKKLVTIMKYRDFAQEKNNRE